jgi:hypothetical protein
VELDRTEAAPFLEPIRLALQRMAQLEKVAELARRRRNAGDGARADRPALLDLALSELDNHPDTRESQTLAEVRPDDRPAREAWPSWQHLRGPSVTEEP